MVTTKHIALAASLLCSACARQLPIVEHVRRPDVAASTGGSAPAPDTSPNWVKGATARLMLDQFEDCEAELTEARSRYGSSESVRQTYAALSGVLGGAGAATSVAAMPEAFSSSPDDWSRGLLVAGAVISLGGPVLFAILGIDEDSATPRAQYERMYAAHHRARERYELVVSCLEEIYEQPAVVATPTTEDASDVLAARERYHHDCEELSNPIAPPPEATDQQSAATVEPESDAARALATRTVVPTTHWIEIRQYLDQYCHPNAPLEHD